MVKMIHADGFYPPGDAQRYCAAVQGLKFTARQYGWELENFNMILSHLEPVMSRVLGERVVIDSVRSGVFRRPLNNVIHFEEFDSLNEWCFVVALERNTLNLYHHTQADGTVDAHTALEGYSHNYRNLFEWDLHTNILMEPNQGVFFRPWVFHSLDSGLVQYYRLIADRKFRILILGPQGSARKALARAVQAAIEDSVLLVSADVRTQLKDVDFSEDGRSRHTYRMLSMARKSPHQTVILDMVCGQPDQRELINADIVVYTPGTSDKYCVPADFCAPTQYDLLLEDASPHSVQQVVDRIHSKRI
jgi:hypothetical protein